MFKIKEYPKYISSVIDNIEKNEESMEVIYYKEWLLPFQKHNVNIQSIIYKNISIIEEFILKIGLASLGKNVTKDYIAEMLGLDMIFIETYIKKLAEDEFIYSNKLPIVETTSKGELYCEKKTTLDRIKEDSFQVYYNPQINITYNPTNLLKSTNEKEDIEILNLDFTFKDKIDNINEKLKENLLDMAKENNIIPVKKSINQQLKSITMKSIKEEIGYLRILELWIYDIVDKSLQCRVWNFEDNTFNNEISKFIVDKKPLKEEDFIISDELKEIPVTNNSNLLEEKFIKSKKEKKKVINKESEFRIIRGKDIKSEFNKTFDMVTNRMYIQSPWISDKVVDEEMIKKIKKLAQNNCKVFITWGISRDKNYEDRKPPEELLKELKDIKSPDNLPAVFVIWIGNHHNKEIIVDNKIHIAGSFNWLSYRGDYLPRGESVYLTNDKECIKEAKYYLEEQIVNSLSKNILNDDFYSNLVCLLNLEYHEDKVREILNKMLNDIMKENKFDDEAKFLINLIRNNEKYSDVYKKQKIESVKGVHFKSVSLVVFQELNELKLLLKFQM